MGATHPDNWWRERGADELRDLLYEWDPIGVSTEPDWPGDEYDELMEPLRRRLAAGAPAGELAVFLEQHDVGWSADADGSPAPLLPAHPLTRAVRSARALRDRPLAGRAVSLAASADWWHEWLPAETPYERVRGIVAAGPLRIDR